MAQSSEMLLERPGRTWTKPLHTARSIGRKNPLGVVGAAIILVLVIMGAFAPVIAPYGINEFVGPISAGPSTEFMFGTDKFGRDIFSRVVHGARISIQISFVAVIGGTILGLLIGALSGYRGGSIDMIIQRVIDTAIAFPALVLLLIIVRLLEPSVNNVTLTIGILIVPSIARTIRGQALQERNKQYVEAASALGATDRRVLLRHIVPNLAPLAIIIASTMLSAAILAEAALSFLGLGVPPPNPSWGAEISLARAEFPINVAWAFFPGLAITLTVLGFSFLGDALRDILDPRLSGSL
jgi:peptide/nickel transport system permease protein